MNIKTINHVADLIESDPLAKGFTMTRYASCGDEWVKEHSRYCKTPACISGWTLYAREPGQFDANYDAILDTSVFTSLAEEDFGLSTEQALILTLPEAEVLPKDFSWDDITRQHAVLCLRNLARTGEVDWRAAIEGRELGKPDPKKLFDPPASASPPADSTCVPAK